MWKENDVVRFGAEGVCRITSVEKLSLTPAGRKDYYILEPLYGSGTTIYVEVEEGERLLRPPLSAEEINRMIDAIPEEEQREPDPESDRVQVNTYLKDGNMEALLLVISALYRRGQQRRKAGKEQRSADRQNLQRAETAVNRELGYGLGIDPSEVPGYIRARLEG